MSRRSFPFSFDNGRGDVLSGILDMPEGTPLLFGVFAPCFACTKESHGAHKTSKAMAERGIAMLRFDMTGLGTSRGDFKDTNFTTRIQDIIAACRALAEKHEAPQVLIGHSISGTAALAAVAQLPEIKVLGTLGSPRDPVYIMDKFKRNNQIAIKGDMAELTIAGRKVMVKASFGEDMLAQDVPAATAAYNRKLFVFHAPHDDIVSFENANAIYNRATCDKELIRLSDAATHLLEQGTEDAAYMADIISDWFRVHT